ncbi:hypothetical protein [Streptomyces cyaneofuscatus]|uniref:hypothetical protein n=1 Tax=Streptomyces cyaneofuscatus TaxID=66883 RepID=UPI003808039E
MRRQPPSTHRTFDVEEIDKSESSRDILAEPTLLFSEAEKQRSREAEGRFPFGPYVVHCWSTGWAAPSGQCPRG